MDHTGKNAPTFGRLEENLGVNKQKSVDISGGRVGNDAMEVGDGQEEGTAVHVNKGKSAEEGVPPVPTPVKSAERVVTWSDGEDTKQAGGVGGGDHGGDDFPSIPRRKKKRKSTVVISDSDIEGEDDNGEGHGIEDVHGKHVPCVAESGSGKEESDEDDGKTISEMIEERTRDGELGETKECSIPARKRPSRRALDFGEPKDHEESEDGSEEEESEDGSEEADSSADFIDDEDCSDNPSNTSEEYSPEPPQESDSEVNYKVVIDRIGRRRNASTKEWEYEGDMLSAFAKQPELRLKAVCALYRKQTEEEQSEKATIVHNKQGFSQIGARRYT
jgi:hypothetical protein